MQNPYKDDHIAPWGLQWTDGASNQHFLNVLLNLFHHWWGNASELLLKGFTVHHLNDVFCFIGTAHFIGFQGKHHVELQQQLLSFLG